MCARCNALDAASRRPEAGRAYMKIKTQDLIGPPLDWAVAKCEGYECQFDDVETGPWLVPQEGYLHDEQTLSNYRPSRSWLDGGPLIEQEGIGIGKIGDGPLYANPWLAARCQDQCDWAGPTPLVAAMRCFVASKLGDEVDV